MKILITGANGFIGKNLCIKLEELGHKVIRYDIDNTLEDLLRFTKDCDFVYHLAGVNRPKDNNFSGNIDTTKFLTSALAQNKNTCPIFLSSSIQAELDNEYGKSKLKAENWLKEFEKQYGNRIIIKRFPNIFGKWCNPNYNSVIATWCYNYANDLPIQINDPEKKLELAYIDDVVDYLISLLTKETELTSYQINLRIINIYLAEIHDLVEKHQGMQSSNQIYKALWATYLTYLPQEKWMYELSTNIDNRGSFTELYKNISGQVSVNISKPNITKGNHYHHSKWEYFIVVKGKAKIQEQNIITNELIEFEVDGKNPTSIIMIPGWTHNIISNDEELVTVIYANEIFDKEKPDTIRKEIQTY